MRWPNGPYCPKCGSVNVQSNIKHKTMTHRCRDCTSGEARKSKTMFTLRHGSVMEGSKIKYRAWAVGIYLFSANIKGISSIQLRRELKIGQKAAWFMLHRLRLAIDENPDLFAGPVEADETYMGGKHKKLKGGGLIDMTAVAGVKDRVTKRVVARVVEHTDAPTLWRFAEDQTCADTQV